MLPLISAAHPAALGGDTTTGHARPVHEGRPATLGHREHRESASRRPVSTPPSGRLAPRSRPPTRCCVTSWRPGGPGRRHRERPADAETQILSVLARRERSTTRPAQRRHDVALVESSTKCSPTNGRAPWCSMQATTRPEPPATCAGGDRGSVTVGLGCRFAEYAGEVMRPDSSIGARRPTGTRARGQGASRPHRLRPRHRGAAEPSRRSWLIPSSPSVVSTVDKLEQLDRDARLSCSVPADTARPSPAACCDRWLRRRVRSPRRQDVLTPTGG